MDKLIPLKVSHGQHTAAEDRPYLFDIEDLPLMFSILDFLLKGMGLVMIDLNEFVLFGAEVVMGDKKIGKGVQVVLMCEL